MLLLQALDKGEDVTQVVRENHRVVVKNGKTFSRAPKIQRLITPKRLARKAEYKKERKAAMERSKQLRSEYVAMLKARQQARRESAKKRSSRRSSKKE